jgi:hypothetical protein
MAGALILKPESSAAELVSAVAQVTGTIVEATAPKKRRSSAKPTNGEPA